MIIEFYDNCGTFGFIEVKEKEGEWNNLVNDIKKLAEDYKKTDENYNINDLYYYLKEKGIKFKVLPTEADYQIYF